LSIDYEALIVRAKQDPAHADFSELRWAFTRSDQYDPNEANEDDRTLEEAVEAQDWPRAREVVDRLLQRGYVRLWLHAYAGVISERLGDAAGVERHAEFCRGLMTSIMESGDGRTPDTAFRVVSVEEERTALTLCNLELLQQVLIDEGGRYFDRVTVQGPDDAEAFDLFFDVSIPYRLIDERLDGLETPDS